AGVSPVFVVVADLNGDSKPDLAVANASPFDSGPSLSVLLGNGNGTFQSATDYAVGTSPRAIAVADFNRDGRLDLAVANYGEFNLNGQFTNSSLSVLLGSTNGTFLPAVNYDAGDGPSSVTVADLNSDGNL